MVILQLSGFYCMGLLQLTAKASDRAPLTEDSVAGCTQPTYLEPHVAFALISQIMTPLKT